MITPDPQTVREIARDCTADYLDDARDIAAHVMGHFGMGVPGNVYAWSDAVRTDLSAAVVSWPDEQQPAEVDPAITEAYDALELLTRELAEVAKQRTAYREEVMRLRARLREQQPAEATGGEQAQGGAAGRIQALMDIYYSKDINPADLRAVLAERATLAARVAELEGEREADTRAVADWSGRMTAGRIAEAVEAGRVLESRFADRIAALTERDTKGGE